MSTAGGGVAEGFRRWRQYRGYGGNVPPLHHTQGIIPAVAPSAVSTEWFRSLRVVPTELAIGHTVVEEVP